MIPCESQLYSFCFHFEPISENGCVLAVYYTVTLPFLSRVDPHVEGGAKVGDHIISCYINAYKFENIKGLDRITKVFCFLISRSSAYAMVFKPVSLGSGIRLTTAVSTRTC